jgi:hypothetical protein
MRDSGQFTLEGHQDECAQPVVVMRHGNGAHGVSACLKT